MASSWRELRRRNVVKVGMAYLAAAWLVLQVVSIVFPAFRAPDNLMPVLIVVIALGFPVALVLAWVFELTPEGVRRADDLPQTGPALRRGRKLDFVIIGLLATALSVIVVDQYVLDVVPSPTVRSIAVLPLARAAAAIETALTLDDTLAEAYAALGQVRLYQEWD